MCLCIQNYIHEYHAEGDLFHKYMIEIHEVLESQIVTTVNSSLRGFRVIIACYLFNNSTSMGVMLQLRLIGVCVSFAKR